MAVVQKNVRFTFVINGTSNQVYHLDTGEGLPQHQHDHAHTTACYAGKIVIRKQGKEKIMTKDSVPVILTKLE
jgi:quercetin dioxygenase-like cupin family protein